MCSTKILQRLNCCQRQKEGERETTEFSMKSTKQKECGVSLSRVTKLVRRVHIEKVLEAWEGLGLGSEGIKEPFLYRN